MSTKSTKAEEVVRQYGLALNTLDVKPIAFLLHPEFKFVYWHLGGGHGVRTDIRYIGHLYKTFLQMKTEGKSIKTEFCNVEIEGEKNLCIKLFSPHDRRIIYPMDTQLIESVRRESPEGEILLLTKVKEGLLCNVTCYVLSDFNLEGKISEFVNSKE